MSLNLDSIMNSPLVLINIYKTTNTSLFDISRVGSHLLKSIFNPHIKFISSYPLKVLKQAVI
jgi:hypothetical protein